MPFWTRCGRSVSRGSTCRRRPSGCGARSRMRGGGRQSDEGATRMKIAMMGSGGVGGYFGGRLAAKGYDVTFVARGAHLAAMRQNGLTIESGLAPMTLKPVKATDDPATLGPVDVVLLSVKLWDTA